MATAQDRLNQILPSWYDLLTHWSTNGSLVTAATDALMLESGNAKEGSKALMQSYISQWSAGDFNSLPPIVLLASEHMSSAYGAYAAATETIYLNQEWLLNANPGQIQDVLTEELGHYLDDKLNLSDTQGDEGEYFRMILRGQSISDNLRQYLREEADNSFVDANGIALAVELATAAFQKYSSPSSNTQPAFSANQVFGTFGYPLTGAFTGTDGDDVYSSASGISSASISDISGNLFVTSTGAVNGFTLNGGNGYVSIDVSISGGNYVYPVSNAAIILGDGDSDLNINVDGDAYYNAAGLQANINAGGGADVINIDMSTTNASATYWGGYAGNMDLGDGNDVLNVYVDIPDVTGLDSAATGIGRNPSSSDSVSLGAGDDILRVYARDNALYNALIDMGTGSDTVIIDRGRASSSTIDFGSGADKLQIAGASSDYIVARQANDSWRITKPSDSQFSLTVTGLEEIQFNDRIKSLDVSFFTAPS